MADELRKALELVKSYIKDDLVWSAVIDPDKPATADNSLGALVDAALAASPADVVGEIVAWRVKDSADGWILTHSKAEAEYQSREMSGATIEPLWRRFSTGGGWNRNMDEAPRGVKLLAGWRNDLGKWRSVTARYYPALTLVAGDDCDADDEGYAPEGWHEESETHETLHPINPTAWRHLPPAPGDKNT